MLTSSLAAQPVKPCACRRTLLSCRHAPQRFLRSDRVLLLNVHSTSADLQASTQQQKSTAEDVASSTAAIAQDIKVEQNESSSVGLEANQPAGEVQQARSPSPSWEGGSTTGDEADWVGSKPWSWKDIDWGLTGLVGVILLLSFGAYRVLNHFRVYQHSRLPITKVTTVVERPTASGSTPTPSGSSSSTAAPPAAPGTTGSSKTKPSRSSRTKQDRAASKAAHAKQQQSSKQQGDTPGPSPAGDTSTPATPEAAAAAATAASAGAAAAAAGPSFELPTAGVPGAPQPSPLDESFSSLPAPWAGGELGQLELSPLVPLPDPSAPLQPPELPSIQVEPPAKAVTQAEVAALPTDPSLPSLRERAHIAMRASGAAMEASQRAAAYSAAASSAASRAAEAAEQSAAAAAAVQAALERAAEEAMAEAVKRMNRAVEMVADAESRAAAAAAMATAYQDISDAQAAAATAAADLPAMPAQAGPAGHIANLQQVLHEQLFSIRTILSDWVAGMWAAVVGAVTWLRVLLATIWFKLVGVFSFGAAVPAGGQAGPATGPASGPTS